MNAELKETGRLWLRQALDAKTLEHLDAACNLGTKPGARLVSDQGFTTKLDDLINTVFPEAKPVRVVSFNKTASNNWAVPWHQDRVIVVREKHAVPGFDNWSRKAGVWHCEPPLQILENMLFVRVHLDSSSLENGAMEIAVGSHKAGRVPADKAAEIAGRYQSEICEAERGDVLVLNMLTLHRSRPSEIHFDRRTLRIDYAAGDLPLPLQWI